MTEKMPGIVARNFIYSRVWSLIRRKDMNAIFVFVGDVGRGKSTGALKFAEDLDPGFSVERVVFGTEEFFKLLDVGDSKGKLQAGSVVVFDEAAGSEESMDSRDSMTHTNKVLSYFSTISRAKQLIIIYCVPFIGQLDKRTRALGITGILSFKGIDLKANRSYGDFYWSYISSMSGKTITPKPRLKNSETGEISIVSNVTIPLPGKELIKEYKAKKTKFIDGKISEWRQQLIDRKKGKESKNTNLKDCFKKADKMRDDLMLNGGYSISLIRVKFGLSEKNAQHIKTALACS